VFWRFGLDQNDGEMERHLGSRVWFKLWDLGFQGLLTKIEQCAVMTKKHLSCELSAKEVCAFIWNSETQIAVEEQDFPTSICNSHCHVNCTANQIKLWADLNGDVETLKHLTMQLSRRTKWKHRMTRPQKLHLSSMSFWLLL